MRNVKKRKIFLPFCKNLNCDRTDNSRQTKTNSVRTPIVIDKNKTDLPITAPKKNAEFVQVASAIFQRQKVLALAIKFGTFYIFSAVRQ
jgi:hypothetical protein